MKFKITLIIFLISIINAGYSLGQKVPLIINSYEDVFKNISKDINLYMPDNVEILIYQIYLLNGDQSLQDDLNEKFKNIFLSMSEKYKYSALFEKDIIEKYKDNKEIDLSFLEKQDELELIAFGKLINLDCVMTSSITVIEGKTKKLWDSNTSKVYNKTIYLFQGIFFNTETNLPVYRFSYFFYY